jgi:hypothetical protein
MVKLENRLSVVFVNIVRLRSGGRRVATLWRDVCGESLPRPDQILIIG